MTKEIALYCMKAYSERHNEMCEECPIYGQTGDDHCFEDALQYVINHSDVLDKIRAEILEEKECAYADFERYKVEYLGQDWEDAYDSLPQDDFRYGMARCIEIIDKYREASE